MISLEISGFKVEKAPRTVDHQLSDSKKILTFSLISYVYWNKQDETCPDSYCATIIQRDIVLLKKTSQPKLETLQS